jgi:hypothetical protein
MANDKDPRDGPVRVEETILGRELFSRYADFPDTQSIGDDVIRRHGSFLGNGASTMGRWNLARQSWEGAPSMEWLQGRRNGTRRSKGMDRSAQPRALARSTTVLPLQASPITDSGSNSMTSENRISHPDISPTASAEQASASLISRFSAVPSSSLESVPGAERAAHTVVSSHVQGMSKREIPVPSRPPMAGVKHTEKVADGAQHAQRSGFAAESRKVSAYVGPPIFQRSKTHRPAAIEGRQAKVDIPSAGSLVDHPRTPPTGQAGQVGQTMGGRIETEVQIQSAAPRPGMPWPTRVGLQTPRSSSPATVSESPARPDFQRISADSEQPGVSGDSATTHASDLQPEALSSGADDAPVSASPLMRRTPGLSTYQFLRSRSGATSFTPGAHSFAEMLLHRHRESFIAHRGNPGNPVSGRTLGRPIIQFAAPLFEPSLKQVARNSGDPAAVKLPAESLGNLAVSRGVEATAVSSLSNVRADVHGVQTSSLGVRDNQQGTATSELVVARSALVPSTASTPANRIAHAVAGLDAAPLANSNPPLDVPVVVNEPFSASTGPDFGITPSVGGASVDRQINIGGVAGFYRTPAGSVLQAAGDSEPDSASVSSPHAGTVFSAGVAPEPLVPSTGVNLGLTHARAAASVDRQMEIAQRADPARISSPHVGAGSTVGVPPKPLDPASAEANLGLTHARAGVPVDRQVDLAKHSASQAALPLPVSPATADSGPASGSVFTARVAPQIVSFDGTRRVISRAISTLPGNVVVSGLAGQGRSSSTYAQLKEPAIATAAAADDSAGSPLAQLTLGLPVSSIYDRPPRAHLARSTALVGTRDTVSRAAAVSLHHALRPAPVQPTAGASLTRHVVAATAPIGTVLRSPAVAPPNAGTTPPPMPAAASANQPITTTAQGSKSVDVTQLANRVYEILVRRLANERQRRGA